MIGLASTGLVAVTAMGAWSLANNAIISGANATGTSYSASFTGTSHFLGELVQQLNLSDATVYNGLSSTNHNFYYAAFISGGTGIVNGTCDAGSNLFAVLDNTKNTNSAEMVFAFAMKGITKLQMAHYYDSSKYSDAEKVILSTSSNGYATAMPTDWTERLSTTGAAFSWSNECVLDSTGTAGYQALKVQLQVAAKAMLGINFTISWAC